MNEVNEIGRWYDTPIFRTRMKEYMVKWLLMSRYNVDTSDYDEHIYFNYASNKHLIDIKNIRGELDIAPKGRAWLDEQRTR